ncbi:MAG: GTPase family protein [Vibrio sp.]
MKLNRAMKQLYRITSYRFAMLVVFLALPIVFIFGAGIYAIFYFHLAIEFALASLLITISVICVVWLWQKQRIKKIASTTPDEAAINQLGDAAKVEGLVQPSVDWSKQELHIWQQAQGQIQNQLRRGDQWQDLQPHGLDLLQWVAEQFDKKAYDFTLVEGLGVLEEISRRYRRVLNQYVPGVDSVTLSQIIGLYHTKQNYGDAALNVSRKAMLVFRLFRLSNPMAAVANEFRDKLIGRVTDELSSQVQYNLKRALLQEVVAVGIDLYSGRFEVETQSLQASQMSEQDKRNQAPQLEPIRVVIAGQISSGKSSLVNHLLKDIRADVDALPSTDQTTTYQCALESHLSNEQDEAITISHELVLVDLAGFDQDSKQSEINLAQMVQADLVIWVLKANQSARQLDIQMHQTFNDYFEQHKTKRQPVVMGVLNQVDKLPPRHIWQPPYPYQRDESQHDDQAQDALNQQKGDTIQQAMDYNQSLFNFDTLIALSIAPDKPHFGVNALESGVESYIEDAKRVQLNRQRHDRRAQQKHWRTQGSKLFKGTKQILKQVW